MQRGEGGLEAGDPVRSRLERHLLLVLRVRCVIRRDSGDRAVLQRLHQRGAVGRRPQRGIHLDVRVERANGDVREAEVVRRHLGRRRDTVGACAAQGLHRLPRRQVQQVQRLSLVRSEREVALHHQALGDRRVAREAELSRHFAFVHLTFARQRRLLAVEREPPLREAAVLQRTAHQPGGHERSAVVAEPHCTRVGELGHLGQLRAVLTLRDRGEEADRHLRLRARPLDERAQHRRRVDDRLGVRHREDRAEAAGRRGGGPGGDRLLVLPPGRAQVDVRVDERGRED